MGPAGRAQVTFTRAAYAAGISEKQLRGWLDNSKVGLEGDDDRSEGQWRRFSLIDVVRLGIVGTLVSYGVPVVLAAEIIGTRGKEVATLPNGLTYHNTSIDERLREFAEFQTYARKIVRDAMRGGVLVVSADTPEAFFNDTEFVVGGLRCRFGFDQKKKPLPMPRGFGVAPRPDTSDLRHFIVIDVEEVASGVLSRLDAEEGELTA
ncbi:MAG: hypothetical protein ACRECF_09000 [Methyloceanibacter sp.]